MSLALTNLCLLASDATVRILPDVGMDIRPPVVPGDEFLGFIATQVCCCNGIVMGWDDIFTKFLIFGDIDLFLPFDRAIRGQLFLSFLLSC